MQIYTSIFFSQSSWKPSLTFLRCEPFQWAFEEEKGIGQLNLNESGMCTGEAERKVVPHDKKWPSFVNERGQRSLTLLLLQLEHSCE